MPVRDRYFSYFSFWPLVSIGPAEHFWREADVNREMGNYFFDLEDKFFSELTFQLVNYALDRLSLQAKYLEAGVFPENYSRSEYYRPQGFPESLAFSVSQPTINGYELIGKRNSPNGQLTLPVSLPNGWGQVWLQVEKSYGQTETLPAYTPCLILPFPTTFKNYRIQQSWYGLIDFRLKPNRPSERLAEPRPSPVGE